MKKLFASFFIFVFTLTLALCLVGCAKQCTYRFVNENGTVLSEGTGKKGSTIVAPANPTKASTDEFSYEFIGWDKEVVAVTGDVAYTAKFEQTKRKYTYKFINFDDKPFNSTYTRKFKENVVKEYLDGKGSIESLQIKYKILSHSTLKNMIVRIIIFGVQSNQKCII